MAYSVGASNACTIAGTSLTITKGTGTCSVTATEAADATHEAVTSAPQTITPVAWKVGGFYSPVDLGTPTTPLRAAARYR